MAKNITVSVPDPVAEKISRYRERLSLSKLFVDAVTKELRKFEEVPSIANDLEATIARLRASKATVVQEDYAEGFKAGVIWATKHAEYSELRDWGEVQKSPPSFQDLPESLQGDMMADGDIRRQEGTRQLEYIAWAEGWFHGVQSIWNDVKNKI